MPSKASGATEPYTVALFVAARTSTHDGESTPSTPHVNVVAQERLHRPPASRGPREDWGPSFFKCLVPARRREATAPELDRMPVWVT